MGQWVATGSDFIDADVVRWTEGVFRPRRRGKGAVKLGERRVAAEVLRHDADWIYLLVRRCELLSVKTGWLEREVQMLGNGTETKRRRRTIVQGQPERLLWDDEGVRSVLASRFRGRHATGDDEDGDDETKS